MSDGLEWQTRPRDRRRRLHRQPPRRAPRGGRRQRARVSCTTTRSAFRLARHLARCATRWRSWPATSRDRDSVLRATREASRSSSTSPRSSPSRTRTWRPTPTCGPTSAGTLNVLQAARQQRRGTRRPHVDQRGVRHRPHRRRSTRRIRCRASRPTRRARSAPTRWPRPSTCSFGVPVVTLRPFNTYGPRQSARAVIPTIITQCLSGGSVKLGNLTPTRDLNFVRDTVAGFLLAGERDEAVGRTINLGTGREISIGDLAADHRPAVRRGAGRRDRGAARAGRGQRGRAPASPTPRWRATCSAGAPT